MKKIVGQLVCFSLLAACNVQQLGQHIGKNIDLNGIKTSQPATEDSPNKDKTKPSPAQDDTRFVDRQFANCELQEDDSKASKSITLKVSANTIELVKKDLTQYVAKKGKLNPEDFYTVLSKASLELVNYDLISGYSKLSNTEYQKKQQFLAYAFLYFLEQNVEAKSYLFKSVKDGAVTITSIAFGESEIVEEVGTCGIENSLNVKIPAVDSELPKILCSGEKTKLTIELTDDESVRLYIKTQKRVHDYKYDLNEVEFESRGSRNHISYSFGLLGKPEFHIEMNKAGNLLEKLKLKENRAYKLTLKDFKCRTVVPFDFE